MFRTRCLIAVGATSMALVLVGCGGDDGGSSSGSGDFCDLAQDVENASNDLVNAQDPDEVEKAYNDFLDKAEAAAKKAPSEIKDEMNTSVEAFKKLIKILKANDWDLLATSSDPDFEDVTSDEDFDQASSDVEQFLSDECPDIQSNGDDGTTDTDGDDSDVTFTEDQSVIDAQVAVIQSVFPKLSDEQARCFVEQGLDASVIGDPEAAKDLLDGCNINITDLQP